MEAVLTPTLRRAQPMDPILEAAHTAISECPIASIKYTNDAQIGKDPAYQLAAGADTGNGMVEVKLQFRSDALALIIGLPEKIRGTITRGEVIVQPTETQLRELKDLFDDRLLEHLTLMTRIHDSVLDQFIARPQDALVAFPDSWHVSTEQIDYRVPRSGNQIGYVVDGRNLSGNTILLEETVGVKSVGPVFKYENGPVEIQIFKGKLFDKFLNMPLNSIDFFVSSRLKDDMVDIQRTLVNPGPDLFIHVARAFPNQFGDHPWFEKLV
jgi:hypothetical protein